jgi:hypothetical protein
LPLLNGHGLSVCQASTLASGATARITSWIETMSAAARRPLEARAAG